MSALFFCFLLVAPLAGAWIEILFSLSSNKFACVAPLAGAWIEITKKQGWRPTAKVAPLAGAWIEIRIIILHVFPAGSLLSQERGLKLDGGLYPDTLLLVAPLAGAWIEITSKNLVNSFITVAPLAGAWIEITKIY